MSRLLPRSRPLDLGAELNSPPVPRRLGLRNGWIPLDPRSATGICPSLVAAEAGVTMPNFPAPPLSAWMTGGAGAGTILDTAMEAQFTAWPPTTLGTLPVSNLPTYTPTGSVVTMGASRPTSFPQGFATAAPNVGDGWFNGADERGWYTKIEGCTYPDAWSGAGLPGEFRFGSDFSTIQR